MQKIIKEVFAKRGIPLGLRVGIATGPVVDGVIGQSKFAYDVWGETVNLAARLESHGQPGCIHVSGTSRNLLGDEREFENPNQSTSKASA